MGCFVKGRAMASLRFVLAALCCVSCRADDDFEFQDSPILSSMWEATKDGNTDALDRLLDSNDNSIRLRASYGRGLAWWAWEFQSVYALAAIMAYGGDVLSDSEDT